MNNKVILILGEQDSQKDKLFEMLRSSNASQQVLFDFFPYFTYQSQVDVICFPGLKDLKSEMLQIIHKFNIIYKSLHVLFVIGKLNEIGIDEEIKNINNILKSNIQNQYQNDTQRFASFFQFCEKEKSKVSPIQLHILNIKQQEKSKQYLQKWLELTVNNIQYIQLDESKQETYKQQVDKQSKKLQIAISNISLQKKEDLLLKSLISNTEEELDDSDEIQYQYESEIFADLFLLAQQLKEILFSNYKYNDPHFQYQSIKNCDIQKSIDNYYCPNSQQHYISSHVSDSQLNLVIINKCLKQFYEFQMKNLNAPQQIEEEELSKNQLPIILIGNDDYSRNYFINQICQLSVQKQLKKQNITKYCVKESQIRVYNTQNFDSNSETQIEEFSKFFASQPISFIFYVIQYDRLDTMKKTYFDLVKSFISIDRKQQGIIIINKEESFSQYNQQQIVEYFSRINSNIIIIVKEDEQKQILQKLQHCLSTNKTDNISFEKTIFAQETQQDIQDRQEMIEKCNIIKQNIGLNQIKDLKSQQSQNEEELKVNQQLLQQLYKQRSEIQMQISRAEDKKYELQNKQYKIENELKRQEDHLNSQKVSIQNNGQITKQKNKTKG